MEQPIIMNDAIAFDTHRFVKHMTKAGFTERQAEAMAEEQVSLLNSNLVTKTDLAGVEAALKVEIASIDSSIAQIKTDTIKWVVGIILAAMVVQTTVMVGMFVG